jgi:RES domain-containing protein
VICYRLADYGTPLRTIAATRPARYNGGDEAEPTQYLALHPLGPLAELMRNNDLRAAEQLRAVRTRTWALDAPLKELPEITFDSADDYGIAADDLVGDDHTACRQLAARLRRELRGIIVPSGALPGTRNVVLFGPRVAAPYLTEPVSPLDVPASITSQDGRPPISLIDIVRFKGDPHPALEAWRGATTFRFSEPDWSLTREQAVL